jgi:hypothetical protein
VVVVGVAVVVVVGVAVAVVAVVAVGVGVPVGVAVAVGVPVGVAVAVPVVVRGGVMPNTAVKPSPLKRVPFLPGQPVTVTSIVRSCFPKPEVEEWRANMTGQLARKFPDEPLENIIARHPNGAAARGQRVQEAIEADLTGAPLPLLDAYGENYYAAWRKWWDGQHLDVLTVNRIVQSIDFAGLVDAMVVSNDPIPLERIVIDWRTIAECPEEPMFDNVVQLCASMSCERLCDPDSPMPVVNHGMVVYISRTEVRAFDVEGELLKRGLAAWAGILEVAKAMYPGSFK